MTRIRYRSSELPDSPFWQWWCRAILEMDRIDLPEADALHALIIRGFLQLRATCMPTGFFLIAHDEEHARTLRTVTTMPVFVAKGKP